MVKVAIKSEKLTPFGGIFSIMDTALSFKEKKMTKAPLPDSVRIGQVSLAVFQTVIFFLKSNFFHFWAKNRINRVKLFEICLISSAKPFFLSAFFLRRPFHAENMVQTIL
ncbi:MAG: hypothetical protein MR387_08975 [Phocaeicola plebeius]|nr:hypothetical protein [Phocaeicola plebeius]